MSAAASQSVDDALALVEQARAEGRLTAAAVENIRCWLTEDRYASYREETIRHIQDNAWKKLDDVFWTVIPFGTGGRRGRMYPIGSNAINDRTIGESAQGLGRLCTRTATLAESRWRVRSPTTRGISRGISPNCARRIMVASGFQGLFPGRLSQHAGTLVPGPLQAVRLRHHGHRQPQSAERQRGEGLLVQRRAGAAAAR